MKLILAIILLTTTFEIYAFEKPCVQYLDTQIEIQANITPSESTLFENCPSHILLNETNVIQLIRVEEGRYCIYGNLQSAIKCEK